VRAVRRCFKITEPDLETIRDWVRATNIRWGMDAAHRRRLGLPDFASNSWQAGLDRLLLGHSLAAQSGQLFEGILPFDDLEGSAADVAGRLAEYIERLFKLVRSLEQPRTVAEWAGVLAGALDEFFISDDAAERELQTIRSELAALRLHARDAGCEVKLPLSAVLEQLRPALEASLSQSGFLTGGVTFCGLKPMRSVPFKIVCVIGLDDTAFPRPAPQSSFDLMARHPRLGDRSAREDDRYLFLEILLSARERLHLSYVGLSARDNREAPPSVLVNELLDYLEQGFGLDRKKLTTRHRLQAFSPEYFKGRNAKLFSYSKASAEASRHAKTDDASSRIVSAPFLVRPLGEPEPEFHHLSLDELIRFFANPARAFLQRRMKLFLPDEPEEIEEREVFHLEKLGENQLKKQLLESRLNDHDNASVREILRAEGSLPVGTAGDLAFRATEASVAEFWKILAPQLPSPALAPLDLALTLGEFEISGRIHPLSAQGPLVFRCAKLKANDLLRAWLLHLAANMTQPGRITTLVTEDELYRFRPPEDARQILGELLNHYWAGLQAPLKFFPKSALAFAKQSQPGTKAKTVPPIVKARAEWEGNEQRGIPGEKDDAANTLCFRETDPLDAEFERLAGGIFAPVLEHQLPDSP
jgi:exodeoxyribonuclease V gamma subunit